jgi:hypothetical protein
MMNSKCDPGNVRVIKGSPSKITWYSLNLSEDLEHTFPKNILFQLVKKIQSKTENYQSLTGKKFIDEIILGNPGKDVRRMRLQEALKKEILAAYNRENQKKKKKKKNRNPTVLWNLKEMLKTLSKKLTVRVSAMEEFGQVIVKLHLDPEAFPLSIFADPADKIMRDFIVGKGLHVNQTVSGMSVRNVSDPIDTGNVDLLESFSTDREPVMRLYELMKRVVCWLERKPNHQERKVAVNLSILSSTSATKPQPAHTDLAPKTNSRRVDDKNPRPWSFVFPVLESGSQLNVWGSEKEGSNLYEKPTKVECEPNTMLLWHYSLIHGGGLPGIKDTLDNVRFHGYVTVDLKVTESRKESISAVSGKHELFHTFSNGGSLNSKLHYPENPENKGDDRTIS